MSPQLNIFITGATGLIGGTVLGRLLQHSDAPSFHITALVRSSEKGDKLKALGVNYILGSYTDEDLSFLTDAAAQSDVVIAAADSDALPAARAILKGLKTRYEQIGRAPILIHTSGTAFVTDDARGLTSEHVTYSDLDVERLNTIPESVIHRNVDISNIEADKAGYVRVYTIAPALIFGHPSGPLVDHGIQNTHSILIQFSIKPSFARKQAGYIGKGLNKWPCVSTDDTADFYVILFDIIRKDPGAAGHGPNGYYFLDSFLSSSVDKARSISEAFVEFGIAESKEPTPYNQEELDTLFGPFWPRLATNCYARGDRSRALGWKPKDTSTDFVVFARDEVKYFIETESK